MLNNNLKNRFEVVKEELKNTDYNHLNFNFKDISGDSKVRKIPLSSLTPAPSEWNFYKPLNNDKMTELIDSILSKGLLNPIVVWEQEENVYMILSGHNRVKAYEYIYNSTKDTDFESIFALIKERNEITEEEAREIIIDTNWVQRELSPIEKSRSILEKYTVLQNKQSGYGKRGEGTVRDIIAQQYNLSGRQIERYKKLTDLIPQIQELVNSGYISPSPASDIAVLEPELQLWIYDNFKNKIKSSYTRKIKQSMTKSDIESIFYEVKKGNNNYIKIKLNDNLFKIYAHSSDDLKERLEHDFQIFYEEWIKNKI